MGPGEGGKGRIVRYKGSAPRLDREGSTPRRVHSGRRASWSPRVTNGSKAVPIPRTGSCPSPLGRPPHRKRIPRCLCPLRCPYSPNEASLRMARFSIEISFGGEGGQEAHVLEQDSGVTVMGGHTTMTRGGFVSRLSPVCLERCGREAWIRCGAGFWYKHVHPPFPTYFPLSPPALWHCCPGGSLNDGLHATLCLLHYQEWQVCSSAGELGPCGLPSHLELAPR